MDLNYKIIKRNEHKTSNWAGGTTTELFIYPENSSYQERNFTWRISSATVDLDTSKFTQLVDYERIIMVLEGKLILNHDGIDSINLKELEQFEFDGGINTDSIGKVTDFNVMMRKGKCKGRIEVVQLGPKSTLTTIFEDDKDEVSNSSENVDVYYNMGDKLKISINESSTITLENKDILIIYKSSNRTMFECYNNSEKDAILIKSSLLFNNK